MADNRIQLIIEAANRTRDAFATLQKDTEQSTRGMTGLQSAVTAVAAAFGAWELATYARESALLAARVETLGAVIKVVGNNAGYTSSQMDMYAQQVAKMGITTRESMNSVIKMASSKMDLAKATQLARVAQDAATIGEVNSSEALGRMIDGIRSGEVEILKTLGLNVSFEQSYKKMDDKLGKNAKSNSSSV